MNETVYWNGPARSCDASVCLILQDGTIESHPLNIQTIIGRDKPDSTADIRIASSIVSSRHGQFYYDPARGYIYTDLGSLNGTFINGSLFGKDSPLGNSSCVLSHGDVLRIDQKNLHYAHKDAVLLLFFYSTQAFNWNTQMITDDMGDIVVGREARAAGDMRFNDAAMSRKHATFHRSMNGWTIVDNHSTNGVYVNNQRITQPCPLKILDTIRIADTTFVFMKDRLLYNADEAIASGGDLVIDIQRRTVRSLFSRKVLLQDIRLTVHPGEMVLILGGSGAGKTTFINAVMGYEKAEGSINVGDVDLYREYASMRSEIGFVPQKDLLRDDDSVFDTLNNAAELKMPKGTDKKQRLLRIDAVMEQLGLQREKDSLVRKLSGGQKKRLSIATEFISDPSLFFLDEPDSGLDGVMARSLMENLRVIADDGKIVMVITHQPDRVADLFDKVIVLAKSAQTNSGRLAFYGSIREAMNFFDTESLEGIVRKINRPDEGGEGMSDYFIEKYKHYAEGQHI